MGQFCDAEIRSATGRADAVVKTANYIYLFEFKLNDLQTIYTMKRENVSSVVSILVLGLIMIVAKFL